MKKILPLLLALALVCGLTSCNSIDVVTAGLKVEVTGVERAADGTVHVAWRVQNPNIFPYLLHKTAHKLSLNGTLVGTIADDAPLGVPAQSQAERIGVLTPAKSAPGALINQAVAQGSAAYHVDSVVTILLLDDKFEKITLKGSGTVTVTAK